MLTHDMPNKVESYYVHIACPKRGSIHRHRIHCLLTECKAAALPLSHHGWIAVFKIGSKSIVQDKGSVQGQTIEQDCSL